MEVVEVDHPLAAARLSKLRESATDAAEFRHHLSELSRLLVYEACHRLPLVVDTIDSPLGATEGVRLASSPLLVPVLRAGLGMLDAALALLPDAEVAFVGARRMEGGSGVDEAGADGAGADEAGADEAGGAAAGGAAAPSYEHYMNRIPTDMSGGTGTSGGTGRAVLVLDPALATGGTLAYTGELAAKAGAASITAVCVLAAPEGIAAVRQSGFFDRVVTAAIDSHLNDDFYIIPGLGDAGDRLYGP